MLAQFMMNADT